MSGRPSAMAMSSSSGSCSRREPSDGGSAFTGSAFAPTTAAAAAELEEAWEEEAWEKEAWEKEDAAAVAAAEEEEEAAPASGGEWAAPFSLARMTASHAPSICDCMLMNLCFSTSALCSRRTLTCLYGLSDGTTKGSLP